jgi:hypothetical protein
MRTAPREEFHYLDLSVAFLSLRSTQHEVVMPDDDARVKRHGQRKEGERDDTDP